MNLDEKLQIAKLQFHNQTKVDIEEFKSALFQAFAADSAPRTKQTTRKKWIAVLAGIVMVVVPTVSYAGYQWMGVSFSTNHLDNTKIALTILDTSFFDDMINGKDPNTTTFSLADANMKANFPIREPDAVAGWTKIRSIGWIFNSDGNPKDAEVHYDDLYQNAQGQRVAVEQVYDDWATRVMNDPSLAAHTHFGATNATVLSDFGDDFAFVSDLQNKRYHLQVTHKESHQVTEIDIWGNAGADTLDSFAHAYLKASVVANSNLL